MDDQIAVQWDNWFTSLNLAYLAPLMYEYMYMLVILLYANSQAFHIPEYIREKQQITPNLFSIMRTPTSIKILDYSYL